MATNPPAPQTTTQPQPRSNEQRYFDALKRIAKGYDSAERVVATAERKYGLTADEALTMAYENIQAEAAAAIHGRRRPKS